MSDLKKATRLKTARELRFETAQEAADAMGVKYGTYAGHENGQRGITQKVAQRYADFYRVRVEWLLTGRGAMKGGERDDEFVKLYNALKPTQQRVVDLVMVALQQAEGDEDPS